MNRIYMGGRLPVELVDEQYGGQSIVIVAGLVGLAIVLDALFQVLIELAVRWPASSIRWTTSSGTGRSGGIDKLGLRAR